jgi:ParB-like chromosome segregation protein Spo0J
MTEKVLHPAAKMFPALSDPELDDLTEDIRANGLLEAITLHPDGSILDGRNRYRACHAANVQPRFTTWEGKGSAYAYVISKNLHRRHLTTRQRSAIAADIANMENPAHYR